MLDLSIGRMESAVFTAGENYSQEKPQVNIYVSRNQEFHKVMDLESVGPVVCKAE